MNCGSSIRKLVFYLCALCLTLAFRAGTAAAATVSVGGVVDQCSGNETSSTDRVSFVCDGQITDGFAFADFGTFGAATTIIASNSQSGYASMVAGFDDEISVVGANSGFVRFIVAASGQQIASVTRDPASQSFSVGGNFSTAWAVNGTGGSETMTIRMDQVTGLPVIEFSGAINTGTNEIDVQFTNSQLAISASVNIVANCTSIVGLCLAQSDFGSTFNFIGATVFDSNGNQVANAGLNSASGFDYINGIELSQVPAPASLLLLLSALGGVGALSKARRSI